MRNYSRTDNNSEYINRKIKIILPTECFKSCAKKYATKHGKEHVYCYKQPSQYDKKSLFKTWLIMAKTIVLGLTARYQATSV